MHDRALSLVYDESPYLSFDELLIKGKSVSFHQRHLQFLVTKIFLGGEWDVTILREGIFQFVNKPYNLRNNSILLRKRNRSAINGTESISY